MIVDEMEMVVFKLQQEFSAIFEDIRNCLRKAGIKRCFYGNQ